MPRLDDDAMAVQLLRRDHCPFDSQKLRYLQAIYGRLRVTNQVTTALPY